MTTHHKTLTLAGLESVYDVLAAAIDEAGPDKAQLFLVKLALLSANAQGAAGQFQEHVRVALANL